MRFLVAAGVSLVLVAALAAAAGEAAAAAPKSLDELLVDSDLVRSFLGRFSADEKSHLIKNKAVDSRSVSIVVGALKRVAAAEQFGETPEKPMEEFQSTYLRKLIAECTKLRATLMNVVTDGDIKFAHKTCQVLAFDKYFENQLDEMWFHGSAASQFGAAESKARLVLLARGLEVERRGNSPNHLFAFLELVLSKGSEKPQLPLDESKRIEWASDELDTLRAIDCKLTEEIRENLLWLVDAVGLKHLESSLGLDEQMWMAVSRACAKLAKTDTLQVATNWSKSMNVGDVMRQVLRTSQAARGLDELQKRALEFKRNLHFF